jgi:hypothetical protein
MGPVSARPFAIAALLFACSSEDRLAPPPAPPVDWASLHPTGKTPVEPKTTATPKERATAEVYLAALGSAGFAALGAALADEAHFRFDGDQDVLGRAGVIRAHAEHLGGFDDRRFMLDRLILTDSSQVLEWSMSGRRHADGETVALRGVALLWTSDDGSISDVHLYFGGPSEAAPRADKILEQTRSSEEADNVTLARAKLQALEDGNEATYLSTLSDDVEVFGRNTARGKAAARAYLRTMRASRAYLAVSVENTWGAGTLAAVEYHLIGEQKGALVRSSLVDVAEIRGSKIARLWRYGETP